MNEAAARDLLVGALRSLKLEVAANSGWRPADDQTLRDLGVDSLALFEFVTALEEIGSITFDDADVDSAEFTTVASVLRLLQRYEPDG
jgi:acyl carrier protein